MASLANSFSLTFGMTGILLIFMFLRNTIKSLILFLMSVKVYPTSCLFLATTLLSSLINDDLISAILFSKRIWSELHREVILAQ